MTRAKPLNLLIYTSAVAHDKAYLAGYEAAKTELSIDDNPFSKSDDEFRAWEEGWWDGFYNDVPLYINHEQVIPEKRKKEKDAENATQ